MSSSGSRLSLESSASNSPGVGARGDFLKKLLFLVIDFSFLLAVSIEPFL